MKPIADQLNQLAQNKLYLDALNICNEFGDDRFEAEGLDKETKIKEMNEGFAYHLFHKVNH